MESRQDAQRLGHHPRGPRQIRLRGVPRFANGVPSWSVDSTRVSASEFAAQHHLFFKQSSGALLSRPHRHIWSEALMGSHSECNATTAGVLDFLGVTPMRDNCGAVSPQRMVVAGAAVL